MKIKEAFNIRTLFVSSLFLNVALLGLTTHLSREFQDLYESVVCRQPAHPAASATETAVETPMLHVSR